VLVEEADIQDAVQEAMTRVWRKRATCRSPQAPESWVRRIAHNEALRVVAASGSRRGACAAGPTWEAADTAAGLATDRVLLTTDVNRALAGLADRDRALVRLRYEEDLAQTAIATRLGMPDATIRVQLHRLRKRLTSDLSELR
jgi:RNA polymerase sigma-70 factor (ECF subfamily)